MKSQISLLFKPCPLIVLSIIASYGREDSAFLKSRICSEIVPIERMFYL